MSSDATFREQLSPETLVRMQIDRCNISASWDDLNVFNANVMQLMRMLPSNKRIELEAMKEDYTGYTVTLQYRKFAGHDLGTPEKPFLDEDGNVLSPIEVAEEYIDYNTLFVLIMLKLEEAGLLWRHNTIQVDGGRVDEEEAILDLPVVNSPTFESDEEEEYK